MGGGQARPAVRSGAGRIMGRRPQCGALTTRTRLFQIIQLKIIKSHHENFPVDLRVAWPNGVPTAALSSGSHASCL